MRTSPWLLPLSVSLAAAACGAPTAPVGEDVGDALAVVDDGCKDACTADSDLVATRHPLTSRAHAVAGTLVFIDDATIAIEDFGFDGGGIDVRAVVAASEADLAVDDARIVLSEDLRRPGGYDGARLTFQLPDGVTIDDVGAFSIWCVPFGASFGDVTW